MADVTQQPYFNEKEKNLDQSSMHEKGSHESVAEEIPIDHDAPIKNDGHPFPVDPRLPEETTALSFRAVIVGSLLGLIVGASNIYLGLKTGFTFGAALFGAIFGFAILKPIAHALPEKFGGGYFGQKENCTVQTAATSAGGLTSLFVAAVPAMYHLGLMKTPKEDIGRLFLLTSITAFYGLFFAIPLRKYYILQQKLVFPSPTATAFTIRSLHSTTSPAARLAAAKKIKILAWSFGGSLAFRVLSAYAPGILWDWHIFWWIYTWGGKGAIAAESWGWYIELTPAFLGAGALSGLNASWSFMMGSVIAWGIIGPVIVKQGLAFGIDLDEAIPGYKSYMSMSTKDPINHASPRYWMLWPGVLVMLAYSFAEVAWSAPIFWRSIKGVYVNIRYTIRERRAAKAGTEFTDEKPIEQIDIYDPAPKEEQVPMWGWTLGLLASAVGTLVVGKLSFGMDVGVGILALVLAFILSFIGVQSSGTTDVNPVGTIAKASQLIVGGVTKGQGLEVMQAQRTNLIAGSIAGQAASHAVDMVGDLKTGHLLGASPQSQFWAQVFGSVIGIWLSVGLFVLFASAYPCITDLEIQCTAFGMPAVSAWRSVAVAVTSPVLPIPRSSGITAIVLAIVAVLTIPIKYLLVPEKYRPWIPNWNAIGLGFVVPQTYYPIAMVIGAHVAYSWEKKNPKSWEVWGFALCAGFIAGEGMGGVFTALLVILKADGGEHGSAVACPGYSYCG